MSWGGSSCASSEGVAAIRSTVNMRSHGIRPNENKMSDGGRERASLAVGVRESSQKSSLQRSAVRSIAWLGL